MNTKDRGQIRVTETLETSLAFHGIDRARDRSAFAAIVRMLRREAMPVLDRFYERVRRNPESARYFSNDAVIDGAKKAQFAHWTRLFEQELDADYMVHARRVGEVHARIGLEPSLYFGAYAFVLGELLEPRGLARWLGWLPFVGRRARINAALVRAALFDMNIAISTVLDGTLQEVGDAAMKMEGSARELADASRDLAHRTEGQAHDVSMTVQSLQQSAADGAAAATTSRSMTEEFNQTREEAQRCESIATKAGSAMEQIEESSTRIGHITELIDGIAFQTSLLALNAGVEAARAGDAGKGFAVVASEVRALAQRSADAARDIKTLIADSSQQVHNGAELVSQTGEAATRIIAKMDRVLGMINTITGHREAQGQALDQINTAMANIETTTLQNTAMSEQSMAVAASLAEQTSALNHLVARFHKRQPAISAARVSAAPAPVTHRIAA